MSDEQKPDQPEVKPDVAPAPAVDAPKPEGTPAAAAAAAPKPAAPPVPKKWEPTGEVVSTPVTERLAAHFGDAVQGVKSPCGEAIVLADKDKLVEVLSFLKGDAACGMDYLGNLTAAHYPNNDKKFEVVYDLFSIEMRHSLRVKVALDDGESCPTAVPVWPTSDWQEREVHDMYGVVFEGHPNLKVILLPEVWDGHPLRKEYPLGGPKEAAIRADKFAKPGYMPDDLEAALRIVEEGRRDD
jgi:NADH-quinone oxidoreductase subunit C